MLPSLPATVIAASIRIGKFALPISHVVQKIAHILAAIWPCFYSVAIHHVVLPIAILYTTICPLVYSYTMDCVYREFTCIHRAISPSLRPMPMLFTQEETTLIVGAIRPNFFACTRLMALMPVACIRLSICALKLPVAMKFAILPLTTVDITFSSNQPTINTGFILFPIALINEFARLNLHTSATFVTSFVPFALVCGSIFQLFFCMKLSFDIICRHWVLVKINRPKSFADSLSFT